VGNRLSSETEAALRAIVREIGSAQGFGEDAREELYAHLEDKTLGYLAGDEKLSEADAVLLARNHFGLARELHCNPGEAQVPVRSSAFARRVAAVVVGDLALCVTFSALRGSDFVLSLIGTEVLFGVVLIFGVVLMLCGMGYFAFSPTPWNRVRTQCNERPAWYLRWRPRSLVLVLGALLLLRWVIPGRLDPFSLPGVTFDRLPYGLEWLGVAFFILWAITWVGWIGKANRSFAALTIGAAVWVALRMSFGASRSLIGWVSPYHDANGDMAFMLLPGGLFRGHGDLLSMSESVLRVLGHNGYIPLLLIVLVTAVYLLQFHLVRATRMYVRNNRSDQQGMPWVTN